MHDRLPGLRKDVRDQETKFLLQVAELPAKLLEPAPVALLKLITSYTSELDVLVQGGQKKRLMIQKCNKSFNNFRIAIRSTAPVFIPKTRDEATKVGYVVRGSDDEDSDMSDNEKKSAK